MGGKPQVYLDSSFEFHTEFSPLQVRSNILTGDIGISFGVERKSYLCALRGGGYKRTKGVPSRNAKVYHYFFPFVLAAGLSPGRVLSGRGSYPIQEM